MKLSAYIQNELDDDLSLGRQMGQDTSGSHPLRDLLERATKLEALAAAIVAWDQRYPKDRIFETPEEAKRPEEELNAIVAAAKEVA